MHTPDSTRRSSRCAAKAAKNTSRTEALKAIREARLSGVSVRKHLDGSEVSDVYSTVDDEQYDEIVRQRQFDNFVEDDDGSGYIDHGADIFDEEDDYEDEKTTVKATKKEKQTKKRGLASFFSVLPKKTAVNEADIKLDDSEVADILKDEEDENVIPSSGNTPQTEVILTPKRVTISSAKLRGVPRNPFHSAQTESVSTPDASRKRPRVVSPIKEVQTNVDDEEDDDDDDYGVPNFDVPIKKKPENNDELMDDFGLADELKQEEPEQTFIPDRTNNTWDDDAHLEDYLEDECINVKIGDEKFYYSKETVDASKMSKQVQVVRMFWLDAYEDPIKQPGKVFLYGKVEVVPGTFESCCIVVENVMRKVFFIPRETFFQNGQESNHPVTKADVYEEVKKVLSDNFHITTFKCPKESFYRLVNCENDGRTMKPIDVLEVHYPSSFRKLPGETSGSTFRSIANTTSTAMERVLVECEMKGPGWIDVSNYVESNGRASYCKYEFSVDMERMKNITYLQDQQAMSFPPMRALTLNVVTALNEHCENEVCMVSCLINNRTNILLPNSEANHLQKLTFICPAPGKTYPMFFKKSFENNTTVRICTSEKHLFSMFLGIIKSIDADIIIGHDAGAFLSRLSTRMEKLKIPSWAMMGRLKRNISLNKIAHSKTAQWELTAGRLVLDTKTSAMELVRCRSYEISELAENLLNIKHEPILPNEVSAFFQSNEKLQTLIKRSYAEAQVVLRIAAQINALPLAIQITNVVGGVASRTLMGGRAERNEFNLLHAFYKDRMIPPDKYQPHTKHHKSGKNEAESQNIKDETINEEHHEEEANHDNKKKAQYSGGLVLDPKIGLYDTLILLLDFNSLYPSIIQEFNICFSTVDYKDKDGDTLPIPPESSTAEGILPRELRGLVERRRQVKAMLKSSKNEAEKKQLDIRQMALKLTANSMYGCLGFPQSRFYAKPLAALVTSKGREILLHSKELVEKMGYIVVYGDTDSIMINTNTKDLQQAKKLGYEIKKAVNQCHKLLELDLDGVFRRMLLLKKKKYAALVIDVDTGVQKKELKGLDIVRRDWSVIAKEQGTMVVDFILDPSLPLDEMVTQIRESLHDLRTRLDSKEVPMCKFEILKQLTRDPSAYADVKSQPHAAVAQRLNKTGKFNLKAGDIVKYIICEDKTTASATQRAYHCSEIEASEGNLEIDMHYYLSHQIHPVVSRLCNPIEEMDSAAVAEALGLDPSHYRHRVIRDTHAEMTSLFEQNYEHCDGFKITCASCTDNEKHIADIRKVFKISNSTIILAMETCEKCHKPLCLNPDDVLVAFRKQLDAFAEKYKREPLKCEACNAEFIDNEFIQRQAALDGTISCPRCAKHGQSEPLMKKYTATDLFVQQKFFKSIVDFDTALNRLSSAQRMSVTKSLEMTHFNDKYLLPLKTVVQKTIDQNEFARVDLGALFNRMLHHSA